MSANMILVYKKTGDDEKNVDAVEAASNQSGRSMEHHHCKHSDRSEPINVRAIVAI
ncbi:hypothetical protein D9M69_641300 [compost metagenome]